jgi:hypothetical protein
MMMKHEVTSLTSDRVVTGTRHAVSLHRRNTAKDETEMTKICMMSSTAEMLVAESKTGIRNVSTSNRSNVKKGTMIIGPNYEQPHRQRSPEGGRNVGGVNPFCHDLKRVRWPLNFKPSGIKKYDGSTNPTEWLEVYQLTIEAAGGDPYIMAPWLRRRPSTQ